VLGEVDLKALSRVNRVPADQSDGKEFAFCLSAGVSFSITLLVIILSKTATSFLLLAQSKRRLTGSEFCPCPSP
jgi:hypothetical protein